MLKLKFFILCSLWVSLAVAEDVKCKDEFIETPAFLQIGSELSQQNTRLKNKVQTSSHKWMSFEEAQALIQKVGLTSLIQFQQWSKSGERPKDFPSNPSIIYKEEWTGWGDFLGTGNIAPSRKKEFMSFEEAKVFIRNEGIQSSVEFNKWKREGKRPEDFPSNPNIIYKENWTGWRDFLGTGSMAYNNKEFMSFEEAKIFIQSEGIQTSTEFKEWKRSGKRPDNFPSAPEQTYKEEWTGWVDFLGTGNISNRDKEFMSFEEAQAFIWSEGIQTRTEFEAWKRSGKRPEDFPANPQQIYEDKWTSWSDFLGAGNISSKRQEWISKVWKKSGKRPEDFPSSSARTNKDKSTSGGLGTGNMAHGKKEFMSFEEAEIFIRNEGIQTRTEFEAWKRSGKRPANFPSSPEQTYKEEWTGWNNFLGTGNTSNRNKEFMSFEEAKKYVQTLRFDHPRDFIEWLKSSDRPMHFPPNPHQFYPEWISVKDFLSAEKYISYKEAKTFAQSMAIINSRDFLELMKDEPDIFPDNFPPNPNLFYSKTGDWIDWNDFLGITDQSKNKTDDRRILNTEDNLQNEEMEEDNFVDGIDV